MMYLWHVKCISPSMGFISIPCLTKKNSLTRIEQLMSEDSTYCNMDVYGVVSLGEIAAEKEGLGRWVPSIR